MENLSDLNVVGFIHFIQLYLQKKQNIPYIQNENKNTVIERNVL